MRLNLEHELFSRPNLVEWDSGSWYLMCKFTESPPSGSHISANCRLLTHHQKSGNLPDVWLQEL